MVPCEDQNQWLSVIITPPTSTSAGMLYFRARIQLTALLEMSHCPIHVGCGCQSSCRCCFCGTDVCFSAAFFFFHLLRYVKIKHEQWIPQWWLLPSLCFCMRKTRHALTVQPCLPCPMTNKMTNSDYYLKGCRMAEKKDTRILLRMRRHGLSVWHTWGSMCATALPSQHSCKVYRVAELLSVS